MRRFSLLFLLLSILVDVSSSLSFNIHFSHWGYDPQEILFHQTSSPKNNSSFHENGSRMYTGHHDKVVLPRKKRKNFMPKTCDCSRFDGLMYARPVLLRDEATHEVASFKMTLCLRRRMEMDHRQSSSSSNGGNGKKNHIGMFMFLVPYPWNNHRSDDGIEVGLDSTCSLGSDPAADPVVCAHVHYDSAEELLKTNVRTGDRSCLCATKIDLEILASLNVFPRV